MARKYAWQRALDRFSRVLMGTAIPSNVPEILETPIPAEEAFAIIAELFQQSDIEVYGLHFPPFIMGDATTLPSGTAMTGLEGVLFSEDGSLKWLGSSGTITTMAGS